MKRALRSWLTPLRAGVLIFVLVFGLGTAAWRYGLFEPAELRLYDDLVWLRSDPNAADSRIFIVKETEEDMHLRDYPIRDRALAQLLEKIEQGRPRVIGIDLYRDLPEPRDGSELAELNKVLLAYSNIVGIFRFGTEKDPFKIPPAPALTKYPDAFGFNDFPDTGVVRRAYLYLPKDYASFAWLIAQRYLYAEGISPRPAGQFLAIGKSTLVPLRANEGGYMNDSAGGYAFLQDFRGPRNFKSLSVQEVMQLPDPGIFRGKIVLIGVVAESSNDTFATPICRNYLSDSAERTPGVVIHGQIINQLLRAAEMGEAPTRGMPGWFNWNWLALWCIVGVAGGFWVRSLWLYIAAALAVITLIFLSGWWCLLGGHWVLMAAPASFFLFSSMLMKGYAAKYENEQRNDLMALFSQNVSREIADEIWRNRRTLLRGGRPLPKEAIVTVLFTDLKNYSTISEHMSPSELIDWVNECQALLASLVSTHGGVVNCYMGDGLMAVFGVPVLRTTEEQRKKDAVNALTCAVAMQRDIRQMNQKWNAAGLPSAGLRVGIYTGDAMTGMLGSDDKLAYSVIGDTVNTASRLESFDKEGAQTGFVDGCRILIGEKTYHYVAEVFQADCVGAFNLKGKSDSTKVYKVRI